MIPLLQYVQPILSAKGVTVTPRLGGAVALSDEAGLNRLISRRVPVNGWGTSVPQPLQDIHGRQTFDHAASSKEAQRPCNFYLNLWDVNIGDITEWGEDAGPSRFYQIGP